MQLLWSWILYAFLGVTAFSLLFLWAVRNRQFSDQERARWLALLAPDDSGVKQPDAKAEE